MPSISLPSPHHHPPTAGYGLPYLLSRFRSDSEERETPTYTGRFFVWTCVFRFHRRTISGNKYIHIYMRFFAEIYTRTVFVIENQLGYVRVHALSLRVHNASKMAFAVFKRTRFVYDSFLRVQRQCFYVQNKCARVSQKQYDFSYLDSEIDKRENFWCL